MTMLDKLFFVYVFTSLASAILRSTTKNHPKLNSIFDTLFIGSIIISWFLILIKIAIL